jgi:hypothetical protein
MRNSSLLLSLIICSCASIPDVPVCRQRTVNSAFCTYTISNKDIIIDDTHLLDGKSWIDLKIESIYVPVDSWIKIKIYILDQCKRNNNCSNNIGQWSNKLDSIIP